MEHDRTVKVEMGEVKVEVPEDNVSFGITPITWGPSKDDTDKNIDEIVLNRIKNEHNFDEAWSNVEGCEMQGEKINLEINSDCKQFEVTYITEQGIIKYENDYEDLKSANSELALNSAPKLKISRRQQPRLNTADRDNRSICTHCDATFKHKINLDDHTCRKHPDFIASVSSKIHECTHCAYKTVMKANLSYHTLKHTKLGTCALCNATYRSIKKLDDHIIRNHPDSIASVSSKIHQCTYCTYKTNVKGNFTKHMSKHFKTADRYKLRCIHCDETFRRKTSLDEHIIRKHPDFIASVSRKIHECTYCTYQTVIKPHFVRHMLKHPETADNYKLSTCIHCNAKFKRKMSLDDHIIRRHPDFIASVSSKIHECTHCAFKTVMKASLAHHMLKHPETANSYKLNTCVHCNATFKGKQALDDHTIRIHPDSVASISCKIYECTHCTYKTCMKSSFAKHVLKHSEKQP